MHSSRMRTVRNSSRLGGGGLPGRGGYLVPGGVPCSRGVYLVQGSVPGPGDVPGPEGGVVPGPRGVPSPGEGGICPGTPPPPRDRHTRVKT